MNLLYDALQQDYPNTILKDDADDEWIVQVGGDDYRVTDGDSATNLRTKEQIRLGGLNAPETSKGVAYEDGRATKFKFGDIGGDHRRRILRDELRSGNYELGQTEQQSYGGGAGKRFVGDFVDRNTGESLTNKLFRHGLADSTFETTRAQQDAKIAGELNRAMYGEASEDQLYSDLRASEPKSSTLFKEKPVYKDVFQDKDQTFKTGDREWYAVSIADQIYGDAQFDPSSTDAQGYARSPISNGFKKGLQDTKANLGSFISVLGNITGVESLTDYGDQVAFLGNQAAADHPLAKIARFSDIDKYSDGFGETLYNGFTWLGKSGAESSANIAAVLGAVVAAPVLLPSAGAAGALAIGSIPNAVLHAGSAWNQVDRYAKDKDGNIIKNEDGSFATNRTAESAAASLSVGVAATVLDTLGLKGVINPSGLLTKLKFTKAAETYATRNAVPLATAKATLNKEMAKETQTVLEYLGNSFTKNIVSSGRLQTGLTNLIQSVGRVGTAGTVEGLTEAFQEGSIYLSSKRINEQQADPDEFITYFIDNLKSDELRELAIESFAAGAGIGGSISAAKGTWDNSAALRERAWKSEANPLRDLGTFREASLAIRNKIGQSVSEVQENLNDREFMPLVEFEQKYGKKAKRDYTYGSFKDSLDYGKSSSAVSRVQKGESTKLEEISKGITSLVFTPLGNLLNTAKINAAPSTFKLASLHGGLRDALAGRNKDFQTQNLTGSISALFHPFSIAQRHGFNHTSESAQEAFSDKLTAFGDIYIKRNKNIKNFKKEDYDMLRNQDLFFRNKKSEQEVLNDYVKSFDDLNAEGFELFTLTADTYKRNLHPDDKRISLSKNYKQDWAFKHREIDVEQLNLHEAEAIKMIATRLKTIDDLKKDNEDKFTSDYNSLARLIFERMRNGDFVNNDVDTFADIKTTAGGKQATTLHLSDKGKYNDGVDFSQFYTKNIFSTMKASRDRVIKESVDLDYNGDNNSKLDILFSDMREELLDSGLMNEDQVRGYLGQLALRIQNVDDARYGNYNRLPEKLAYYQDNVLTVTSILGLSLATLSSAAEVPGIAIGLRNSAEFKKFVKTVGKQFSNALLRGFQNVKANRIVPGVSSLNQRLENEFFELQLVAGIPQETETIATRVSGIENVDAALFSRKKRRVLDAFFTASLLKGMTGVTRTVATSTALDFIRNRTSLLLSVVDFDHTKGSMSREQLDAYAGLSQIGINVPVYIAAMRDKLERTQRILTNPPSESDTLDSYISDFGDNIGGKDRDSKRLSRRSTLENEVLTGIQSFVNTRVQAPNASNRPLVTQDPHFKLLTQFNAFLSSVTTTMIPKIWNDEVGRAIRNKNPGLSYDAFAVIAAMVAMGASSQELKDRLKYKGPSPHIEEKRRYVQRAVAASGVLGQGEKLVDIVHPLYPTRGEGVPSRIASTLFGAGGRQVNSITDLFTLEESEDKSVVKEEFFKDLVKFIPVVNSITFKREEWAENLTELFS